MSRKVIQIHNREAVLLQSLIAERDSTAKSLAIGLNAVLARHEIDGFFVGLEGNELYVDVPDDSDPKRDRGESPKTDAGVVGVIPSAPNRENPSESKSDGKKGHSKPPSEPETGPADDLAPDSRRGMPDGVGDFQHSERSS